MKRTFLIFAGLPLQFYCPIPVLHYTSLPPPIHFSVLSRMVQVLPGTLFFSLRELHPSSFFFFFCFRSRSAAIIHLHLAVFHPSSSTSLRLEECNSTHLHQTALYPLSALFSLKSVTAPTLIQTAFTFPLLIESPRVTLLICDLLLLLLLVLAV